MIKTIVQRLAEKFPTVKEVQIFSNDSETLKQAIDDIIDLLNKQFP